jgi:hypothetical protein
MRRTAAVTATLLAAVLIPTTSAGAGAGAGAGGGIAVTRPVNVSADQTSQNETPLAVNPANPANMITGNNDWNYNDGCGVNATFDGGKSWTPTVPNGFLPGITKYTNDPNVAGDGAYDAGGDPAIAFSPDGRIAYFVCQAFNFSSPYEIAMLLNRSYDGGRTWQHHGLVQVSTFNGNGASKGSNGKFPDHESIHVDPTNGYVYVTWAEFSGYQGTHSPVFVAVSRDSGNTFAVSSVTTGNVRNNQDQRIVTDPAGNAYLTFDNGLQGGKGTALYAAKSTDGGVTWSTPTQFATLTNPECLFPPDCFNISGAPFRAGGTYPAPAFDAARNRLDVLVADIRGAFAQMYVYSLDAATLSVAATAELPGLKGDRFQGELSAAPNGRLDAAFYDRSYSANRLADLTYATSADGGATWRTARVSTAGFDPGAWGVPSGSGFRPFVGDYNGIVSTNDFAAMTWTGVVPPQPYNLEVEFARATP